MIDLGRAPEARTQLAAALPGIQAIGSDSVVNLFTGLRMRAAATLDSALADAPRKILERTSEEQSALDQCSMVMQGPKRQYDCRKDSSPVEFSDDAAAVFNGAMPLSTLAQAAQSNALPPQLHQSVAIMTWVRSVLLKNESVARQMLPLLPEKLQQQAGPGVGFDPLMTILRNPGLRPYLDGGVQRSASYDFVEDFADNWWCSDWTANFAQNAPVGSASVAFLSPQIREAGDKVAKALLAMGGAEVYPGSEVLDYAHAHPSDPDVPEALYLTLRLIRYGCFHGWSESRTDQQADRVGTIAREIGAIMRRDYSTNPWTRRLRPMFGRRRKKADFDGPTFHNVVRLYVPMPPVAVSGMFPVQSVRDLPGPYQGDTPPPPPVSLRKFPSFSRLQSVLPRKFLL